jgi:hypothetical protein
MGWGDYGSTEVMQLLEDDIVTPGESGGQKTVTLQKAGYVKKMRMRASAVYVQTASTAAPSKSVRGPLGAFINRIRVVAGGKQPLVDLLGRQAQDYNEVQNRDGSMLANPTFDSVSNVSAGKALLDYTTPGTGAQTYTVNFPFEIGFAIPVFVQGVANELGLFLLQQDAFSVGIEVLFNAVYKATADRDALYSGGTAVAGSTTIASTKLAIERELYALPQSDENRPDEAWAHTVLGYDQAITGKKAKVNMPQTGLILRFIGRVEDANGDPVDWDDIVSVDVKYGAMTTPISRPGWALATEYVQDYGRFPPKGVFVLDFYKWGLDTMKLLKDSDSLANFTVTVNLSTTSTGTLLYTLDTLIQVLNVQSIRASGARR